MDKILSFLGLARRAGALNVGLAGSTGACRGGKGKLLVLARDASDNTKKEIRNLAASKQVPLIEDYVKEELGAATGYEEASVLCVTDARFAGQVQKLYNETN